MRPSGLLLGLPAALRLRRSAARTALAGLLIALAVPGGPVAGGPAGEVARRSEPGPGEPPAVHLPPPPGVTSLVSVRVGGGFAGGPSAEPSISESGRFVAFTSRAPDLVTGDTNESLDVFVRDMRAGTTVRVSLPGGLPVPPGGSASQPSISANGRIVAFTYQAPSGLTAAPGTIVIAWDRTTGDAEIVSRGLRLPATGSSSPSVSGDGRYVAYVSTSSSVVPGDGNQAPDVFRYDRETGRTALVSAGPDGTPAGGSSTDPSISRDGRYVAFVSDAGDSLVDQDTGSGNQVYVRDVEAGTTEQISVTYSAYPPDGVADAPAISGDGRYVAFDSSSTNIVFGDENGATDVFRYDRETRRMDLVSVGVDGSHAKGRSDQPAISASGRVVAFTSSAPDIVPGAVTDEPSPPPVFRAPIVVVRGDSEVFARDLDAGETVRVSEAAAGGPGGSRSITPVIGGQGRFVAFASLSSLLVEGDTNKQADVFLRDLPPVPTVNPAVLDFGTHPIGVQAPVAAAVLTNTGWGSLGVTGASVTGGAAADYTVAVDGCAGAVLHRNEACTVSVLFTPSTTGARSAVLGIEDRFDGSPRTVRLRGAGSLAQLELEPAIGPPGIVVVATGSGFPPGAEVALEWSIGITPRLKPIVTDGEGAFRVQVLVFHNDRVGPRDLVASSVGGGAGSPGAFPPTQARMLVTSPSVAPPGFLAGRLVDMPLFLLIRG